MQNYSALKDSLAGSPGQDAVPVVPRSVAWAARLASVIAVAVVAVLLVLTWLRLFLGVDFTDESFYVALPYRFALGDIPLRDEQSVGQFAGILILPFVRLYLQVMGNSDGIVLYVRHLHLIFTALVGTTVYLMVRPALGRAHALLAGALCLLFVPFNIHSLSYNTLGSGFLTVGCFLALRGGQRASWAMAGLAHGLAILVYPTLLPVALVFPIVVLMAEERSRRWHLLAAYAAGGAVAALLPAALILRAGFDALPAMATYASALNTQLGGVAKVRAVLEGFWGGVPRIGWLLSALALLAAWHALRPRPLRWVLPLLPLLLLGWWREPNGTDNLFLVPAFALLGPFVYPFVRGNAFARRLLHFVWIPSFLAGLVTAWSSGNGAANACIGMFPAAVAALVLAQLAIAGIPARTPLAGACRELLLVAVPLLIVVPLLQGGYTDYYGDPVHRDKLTARVESGPYAGLLTQPERQQMLGNLQRQLAANLRPDDRVLVYNDWTGGYLLAGVRPGINSVWLPTAIAQKPVSRQASFDYWGKWGNEPTVVMLMKASEATPDAMLDVVRGPAFETVADLGIATLRRRVRPITTGAPAAAGR